MTDELKPCPFCGGEAQSIAVTGMVVERRVRCITCRANIRASYRAFDADSERGAEQFAVTAWNHRPTPSPAVSEELVERVARELAAEIDRQARSAALLSSAGTTIYPDPDFALDVRALARTALASTRRSSVTELEEEVAELQQALSEMHGERTMLREALFEARIAVEADIENSRASGGYFLDIFKSRLAKIDAALNPNRDGKDRANHERR